MRVSGWIVLGVTAACAWTFAHGAEPLVEYGLNSLGFFGIGWVLREVTWRDSVPVEIHPSVAKQGEEPSYIITPQFRPKRRETQ